MLLVSQYSISKLVMRAAADNFSSSYSVRRLELLLPVIVSKSFDDIFVFCSLNIARGCGSKYSAALHAESFLCI
jgi:hypothetical protein